MKYATKEQLGQAMREKFRVASGVEVHRLAAKIKAFLDAGDFTDAEMRTLFGATPAEWATLKGKIVSYANAHNATQNARGE